MTDKRHNPELEALAAERALGLLSPDQAQQAAALEASDPAFAAEVARWRGRLAPLLDEIEPVEPPSGLWQRIAQATAVSDESNVIVLRRSMARWRALGVGMTALAASFGLVLLLQPGVGPGPAPTIVQSPKPPLVAMLGGDNKNMKVVASWDPAARQLVLAVAEDMPADPRHAHELWVIPSDGKPRSLGTMAAGNKMHMRLADTLARLLQQGATIAISVEPPGGSPTGSPTGPVVASGSLDQA
jgi:anti-sigma-K factor RskA